MLAAWAWEDEAAGRVRARVFPNGIGIDEDEATGAAALQFGALIDRDVVIRQGEGSELHARPGGDGTVAVGGRVALVSEHLGRPPVLATRASGRRRSGIDTAVILCGGRGTRLQEHVRAIPKPLVEVGGLPIVWHVVSLFARQGVERVLLLTGYRAELVAEFAAAAAWPGGVRVECVDTGLDTPTGGRIHAVAERLAGAPFFATYGDGVADVDLAALSDAHAAAGAVATMTVVRPELPFGVARARRPRPGDRVPREAARRALGQRRLLPLRARLSRRTWSRTSCWSASRWSGWPPTERCTPYPPRGLLGVHGHLQGRARAQRALGERSRALVAHGAK